MEYYRRSASGRETLTTRENYAAFAPERQGRIRYYKKEVPRLAELEVWTVGDNIALGTADRGGQVNMETRRGPMNIGNSITDGNYRSGPSRADRIVMDLGTYFWVDTIHYITDGASPVSNLQVDISDGGRAPDGSILWTRIAEAPKKSLRYREIRIDPAKVRFLRTFTTTAFLEMMLYGEGFSPELTYTSPIIRLGGRKGLVTIEWEADTPPGTHVQLQTATGNTLAQETIYHYNNGWIVPKQRYYEVPKMKRGSIKTFPVPGEDWSPWATYTESGEEIASPSPREFLQLRAVFLTENSNPNDIPAFLHSITLHTIDLYADHLSGEVWPRRIETIGNPEIRSFFIRPSFSSPSQGFDEILISATATTSMELLEVRRGREEDFFTGRAERLPLSRIVVWDTGPDSLWLRLPTPIRQDVELVEVRFRPTTFANSAQFNAAVKASDEAGSWQQVDVDNATDVVDSQTNLTLAREGNEVLKDVRIDPVVLTPNGDGWHDEMVFSFGVARLHAGGAVQLKIHDLGGRLIKKFSAHRPDPRGHYELKWSGDDQAGQRVPPGIYVARLQVEAASPAARETMTTRVVYVAY